MTDLLTYVGRMPKPARIDELDLVAARRLVHLWDSVFPEPDPDDGTGDFEDWVEMASRLYAAANSGAENVWLHRGDRSGSVINLSTFEHQDERVLLRRASYGEIPSYGPLSNYSTALVALSTPADRYFEFESFLHNAGRRVVIADINDFAGNIAEQMALWNADGIKKVVIKHTRPKSGIWQVETSATEDENTANLQRVMDWDYVRIAGGRSGELLMQEFIDMRHEYRLFCVDGVPVTGAGCIEEFTPLRNDGHAFSPVTREHRGTQDPIVWRDDVVSELVSFGSKVADQARTEGMGRAFVLDVALSNGQPVVVEFNGHHNSGLYASDPARFAQALVGGFRSLTGPITLSPFTSALLAS